MIGDIATPYQSYDYVTVTIPAPTEAVVSTFLPYT
jgi:hypothetical protein